jgi:hypothetical protein
MRKRGGCGGVGDEPRGAGGALALFPWSALVSVTAGSRSARANKTSAAQSRDIVVLKREEFLPEAEPVESPRDQTDDEQVAD